MSRDGNDHRDDHRDAHRDDRVVVVTGDPAGSCLVDVGALRTLLAELDPVVEIVAVIGGDGRFPTEAVDVVRESGADGAVVAVPATEAVKRVEAGLVVADVDRTRLVSAALPAAFRRSALARAVVGGSGLRDVVDMVVRAGGTVVPLTPPVGGGGRRR